MGVWCSGDQRELTDGSAMKPPLRIFEDPAARRLRDGVARLAQDEVDYDQLRGLEQLRAALGSAPPNDAAAAAGPSASAPLLGSSSLLVKVIGVAAISVSLVATYRYLSPPPARPASSVAQAPATESPAATPEPVAEEPAAPASAPAAQSGERTAAPRAAQTSSRREISNTRRIQALLADDPAAAHRLIVATSREFPSGVLREERDGLEVIALFRLGEQDRSRST